DVPLASVVPEYLNCPAAMLIVPYTSTAEPGAADPCANAMHGAAKAPATAMVRSFFCMRTPLWFKPGVAPIGPPPTPQSRSPGECAESHTGAPIKAPPVKAKADP